MTGFFAILVERDNNKKRLFLSEITVTEECFSIFPNMARIDISGIPHEELMIVYQEL